MYEALKFAVLALVAFVALPVIAWAESSRLAGADPAPPRALGASLLRQLSRAPGAPRGAGIAASGLLCLTFYRSRPLAQSGAACSSPCGASCAASRP